MPNGKVGKGDGKERGNGEEEEEEEEERKGGGKKRAVDWNEPEKEAAAYHSMERQEGTKRRAALSALLAEMFCDKQEKVAGVGNAKEEPWRWDWRCGASLGPGLVKLYKDGYCAEFHPSFAVGSAALRGNFQLGHNTIAYWEVKTNEVYGSSIMFGIGTQNAVLSTPFLWSNLLGGFCTNSGNESESYGLSHKGVFFHANTASPFCPPFQEGIPCQVGILFDGPQRRLGFSLNGRWMGWAHQKLDFGQGNRLIFYPMVASTVQRSRFTLISDFQWKKFIPATLHEMCHDFIVDKLMENNKKIVTRIELGANIEQFGLPTNIANSMLELCAHKFAHRPEYISQEPKQLKKEFYRPRRRRKMACPRRIVADSI